MIKHKRTDPFTGTSSASLRLGYDVAKSTVGIFADPAKVYIDNGKSKSSDSSNVHGKAALAFGKGMNNVVSGAFKGGMVGVPLAMAEGFRNVPRLWGETVEEQQAITGVRSGAAVAGKVRQSIFS